MKMRIINTEDGLDQFRPSWDDIEQSSFAPSLWTTFDWFATWFRAKKAHCQLHVVVIEDDGPQAILPLIRRTTRQWGIPVAQLELVSEYFPGVFPLKRKNYVVDWAGVIRFLKEDDLNWDIIHLRHIPKDSKDTEQLEAALASTRQAFFCRAGEASPVIEVTGDWDGYFKSRSKNFRKSVRNRLNGLNRMGELKYKTFATPSNVQTGIDAAFQVAQKSWQGQEGTDLSRGVDRTFYEQYAHQMAQKGEMDLKILTLNRQPIAYEFNLIHLNKAYSLKCGYDTQYQKSSPGTVLMCDSTKEFMNRGVSEIYLLGEQDDFKRRWTERVHQYVNLSLYGVSLRARLLAGIEGIRDFVKGSE